MKLIEHVLNKNFVTVTISLSIHLHVHTFLLEYAFIILFALVGVTFLKVMMTIEKRFSSLIVFPSL